MARRTLSSCWKQYEKLGELYLTDVPQRAGTLEKLVDLTEKANHDQLGDNALAPLFVRPYTLLPLSLRFVMAMEPSGELGTWQTRFDPETKFLEVQPLAVMAFINQAKAYQPIATEPHATSNLSEEEFLHQRYLWFLAEVAKLPSIHVLFLLVLQRVAYLLRIAHLEKRGGVIEIAEGEDYHTLLWAFKELEVFFSRTSGSNLRARFGISWYESDWITGR